MVFNYESAFSVVQCSNADYQNGSGPPHGTSSLVTLLFSLQLLSTSISVRAAFEDTILICALALMSKVAIRNVIGQSVQQPDEDYPSWSKLFGLSNERGKAPE